MIELIMGMAIMLVIFGAVFSGLGVSLNAISFNNTASDYAERSREILSAITNEIRSSDTVSSAFPSNHFDYTINGESRSIYLDQTTHTLVINRAVSNPQTIKIAAGLINNLIFSRNDVNHPQDITVTITLLDSNNVKAASKSYFTTIHAPNL